MTWTFQRFAAFLNACLLACFVGSFFPDPGTMLADLFYFVFFALQLAVPVISMFALLPPKPKVQDSRN